jgi:peptidoglycan/LPS O-acetylase OafA/YrhL
MKYIKGLDALRAFAVLSVIYMHWGPLGFKIPWLRFIFYRMIPSGSFGVDIFFVLSGFLITKILLDARNKMPHQRMEIIKSFYARRILRIFPLYVLVILTSAYVFNDNFVKTHIAYFLTYTSNFLFVNGGVSWQALPHTWSLAVEEQFYFIWPWFIVFAPTKYLERIILAFIGFGLVSTLVLYIFFVGYTNFLLPTCFVAFGIGGWFAHVQTRETSPVWLPAALKIAVPISILVLFVHQAFHGFELIRLFDSIIGLGLISFIIKQNHGALSRALLENKFLIWIGKISYGIYLIHFALPFYYFKLMNNLQAKQLISAQLHKTLTYVPFAYLINLVLVVIICSLSYKFIETPFLNLKKYFIYGRGKKSHETMQVSVAKPQLYPIE